MFEFFSKSRPNVVNIVKLTFNKTNSMFRRFKTAKGCFSLRYFVLIQMAVLLSSEQKKTLAHPSQSILQVTI